MRKQLIAIGSVLLSTILPIKAIAQPFDELDVFGDSLVDTGNVFDATGELLPPSPPYFNGRFSNGPIWIDVLSAEITPLNNFAFGGATSGTYNTLNDDLGVTTLPGLQDQVDLYISQPGTASPNSLFVVWAGANDYVETATSATFSRTPTEVVNNLGAAVTRLNNEGANTLIVPNLPNLGATPLALNTGTSEILSSLTEEHNTLLNQQLQNLSQNEDLQIIPLDVNAIFNEILANPANFGFTNVTDACFNTLVTPPSAPCENPQNYLFWDPLHPSARTHEILGQYAIAVLNAPEAIKPIGDIALNVARRQVQHIDGRLVSLRNTPYNPNQVLGVFINGEYNFGEQDSLANESGYEFDTISGNVGVDNRFGENIIVGVAYGLVSGESDLNDNLGDVEIDGSAISGYGSYITDTFYADAVVSFGTLDLEISRNVGFDNRTATADTEADQLSIDVNSGLNFGNATQGFAFVPNVGVRYDRVDLDDYTEAGAGSLNLVVREQEIESAIFSVGALASQALNAGNMTFIPQVRFSYERELLDTSREIITELATQPGIPIRSTTEDKDADYFRLGFGSQVLFSESFSGFIDYETTIGREDFSDQIIRGEVRYQF
ncbi:MAG: autotransporter domain-containing protein [Chroococcales cyanobacterium]